MNANILDGKATATIIQNQIATQVAKRVENGQRPPGLAVILLGDDYASGLYVEKKRQACERVEFISKAYHLKANTDQHDLLALIDELNQTDAIDGILVQLPLPKHIDTNIILERINPDKDVDGFHPYNLGRLAQRRPSLRPCTPYGIMTLLAHYQLTVTGLNTTVVGASNIVGRPMGLELLLNGATVTTCHRFTHNLSAHIHQADLLVVAVGKYGVVDPAWIKPGAIVIDVGMNRHENGRLTGDVDFAAVEKIARWITPVPGGVGPMTVTMLLQNTLFAAEHLHVL
jgi:methylenetetrahydrofolate dehydrogenase (NADP+) / methenyltetrahydrofolate cyclohydrolase